MSAPRLFRRRFLGALAAPLGAGLVSSRAAAQAFTLRFSTPETAASITGMAAIRFATGIRARSNGQLNIEVYPSAQLAKQQETVDGLASGTVDFAIIASGLVLPIAPRLQVLDLPFLFKDLATGYRVLDGAIGTELFSDLEPKGVLGLGWGTPGFLQLFTVPRPVSAPADVKGLRIRIQGGPVQVGTYQALGAIPVTIDASEQFTALQQHAIDGLQINVNAFTQNKYYTICKHLALMNVSILFTTLLGSRRKIQAMPLNLQTLVREEAKRVLPFWRDMTATQIVNDTDTLKKNGVAITTVDLPAFRKVVEPIYAAFQTRFGGNLLERTARTAGVTL